MVYCIGRVGWKEWRGCYMLTVRAGLGWDGMRYRDVDGDGGWMKWKVDDVEVYYVAFLPVVSRLGQGVGSDSVQIRMTSCRVGEFEEF